MLCFTHCRAHHKISLFSLFISTSTMERIICFSILLYKTFLSLILVCFKSSIRIKDFLIKFVFSQKSCGQFIISSWNRSCLIHIPSFYIKKNLRFFNILTMCSNSFRTGKFFIWSSKKLSSFRLANFAPNFTKISRVFQTTFFKTLDTVHIEMQRSKGHFFIFFKNFSFAKQSII